MSQEKFPKECRARNGAILKRGGELLETWVNGNKNDVRDALHNMEPSVAFAVLSYMMATAYGSEGQYIASYFREVA